MNYDLVATWSQVISAIVFLIVLVYMWFRFIQPAVLAAQEHHNERIAEAERHRDEAKAALDTLQLEIAGAQRDVRGILTLAQEQAQRERAHVLEETRSAGERAVRNAEGELERARAAARMQLRTALLDRALNVARDRAERRVDTNVNAILVNRFVASIEHGGSK